MGDRPDGDVLCHHCRQLLESGIKIGYAAWWRGGDLEQSKLEYKPEPWPYHPSCRSLFNSAMAGCHMCSVFIAQLTTEARRAMLDCDGGYWAWILYNDCRSPGEAIRENSPKYEILVAYCVSPGFLDKPYPHFQLRVQISETSGNL